MSSTADTQNPEDVGAEVAHDLLLGGEKKLRIVSFILQSLYFALRRLFGYHGPRCRAVAVSSLLYHTGSPVEHGSSADKTRPGMAARVYYAAAPRAPTDLQQLWSWAS